MGAYGSHADQDEVEGWTNGLVGVSLGPRGRYRLVTLIDEGGMAAVFEATDANLRRSVAIKLIRPALRDDPGFARRFEREAQLVAGLDHAHILPVFDFGETEASDTPAHAGLLYLVMRLVRGTSLRRLLASGQAPLPWTPEKVLELARQILPALEYAHRQGVVHRDFKPENVLIETNADGYHAFLADFGLAKAAESDLDQSRLTQTGQLLGTPFYMAPEQWLGEPPDARTDEYAVGVLLYELLTGEVPYQASVPMAVGQKHLEARLAPPRSRNPAIPDAVAQVVTRALARDPAQRFASCAELLGALTTAVEHDPTKTFVQTVPPVVVPVHPPPTPKPLNRTALSAVGISIVGLLAVFFVARALGWIDPGGGKGDQTPTPTSGAVVVAVSPSAVRSAVAVGVTTPSPTPATLTPTRTATSTPAARTATPAARTATPAAAASATATRTPTPGPTLPSNPVANGRGALRQTGTSSPSGQLAGVHYRNLVADVRLDNPHDGSGRPLAAWDHGLAFRFSEVGEYRLFVTSAGSWFLELRTFTADRPDTVVSLDAGSVPNLNRAPDGFNVVRIVAIESVGYFIVNDDYITTLDLSGRGIAAGVTLPAGDVAVGSGFFDVDRVPAATTSYSAFNVSPLTYTGEASTSPTPHSLVVGTSGNTAKDSAYVNARNVVVFASFNNPDYANGLMTNSWDFGFSFRKARLAESYRLVLTADDNKWWFRRIHHDGGVSGDPTPSPNDFRAVADGTLTSLDTDPDSYNDLLLIAVGNVGHFLLNNTYIARLNLSDNTLDGDVEVATGFFSTYTTSPRTLTYDSFRVWSAAP